MFTNRITAYLETAENNSAENEAVENEPFPETSMLQDGPSLHNPIAPPASFAPVPQAILGDMSQEKLAWQQDLYRRAYQSALAAVALETARRSQLN